MTTNRRDFLTAAAPPGRAALPPQLPHTHTPDHERQVGPSAPAACNRRWDSGPGWLLPRGAGVGGRGVNLAADVEVRVWDSTGELRYLVLPERPAGTEQLSEEQLAALVTRDAMVGVAKVTPATQGASA